MSDSENAEPQAPHKEYFIRLEAAAVAPPDVEILVAESGAQVGFRLPDGRVLKPWIVFEIADAGQDNERDLTYNELNDLGLHFEYTLREVEDA